MTCVDRTCGVAGWCLTAVMVWLTSLSWTTLAQAQAQPAGTGAVDGRVIDGRGEPVAGAAVQLSRRELSNGELRAVATAARATTDEVGHFRLTGVLPGVYYLSASAAISRNSGVAGVTPTASRTAPAYYPGTTSLQEAQPLRIGIGEELTGMALSLIAVPLATVEGTIRTAAGTPATGLVVGLEGATFGSAKELPGATFSFSDVPPGDYVLWARSAQEVALAHISVAGKDLSQPLVLSKTASVRGRLVLDQAGASSAKPEDFRVILQPVAGTSSTTPGTSNTAVRADGTFEAAGAFGTYLVRVFTPPDWTLDAVRRDGTDVTDMPIDVRGADADGLDVVVTPRLTELAGRVTPRAGISVQGASVVIFADDPERWGRHTRFVRTVQLDREGRFTVRGLPAARYLAVAVSALESGGERDPDLLRSLQPRATSLVIQKGERATIDLDLRE